MRAAILLIACLSMTAYVSAEFSLGDPDDGDLVVVQRNITKVGIPILPRIVRLGATAPPDSTISYISVEDLGNETSSSALLIGGIGATKVLLLTKAKAGDGLNIQFTVHAKTLPTTTVAPPETTESTPEPPTPAPPSPTPTTTEGTGGSTPGSSDPTTAAPPSEGPTTGAPSTADPTSAAPSSEGPTTGAPSTADPTSAAPPSEGPTTTSTAGPSTSDDY